ncbi:hypothetical protein GCM10010990_25840 [Croceicoccus mobilis]|uniref:Uncharacterized protein n=1 Tax=Croceicoccus mobilis TaxID=1703339 RepID=A0A916Z421_9SPHN|nr:hypothetical protein GCM10010990_25840 [Croceicoccus mobilis]
MDEAFGDQPFQHGAYCGSVVVDQGRDRGLIDIRLGMERVHRGKLDRRDIEPGGPGSCEENPRFDLVQAADQMTHHAVRFHYDSPFAPVL